MSDSNNEKAPLAIIIAGTIIVLALVGFVLYRQRTVAPDLPAVTDTMPVQPAPASSTTPTAVVDSTVAPPTATSPVFSTAAPPIVMPTATSPAAAAMAKQQPDLAAAPRVDIEQVRDLVQSGSVVVVDVRDAESFAFSHAASAVNLPLPLIEKQMSPVLLGKRVITYCT